MLLPLLGRDLHVGRASAGRRGAPRSRSCRRGRTPAPRRSRPGGGRWRPRSPWRFMITGIPCRNRSPISRASLNRLGSARWIEAAGRRGRRAWSGRWLGAVHGGDSARLTRRTGPARRGGPKVGRFVVEVVELLVLDEPQVLQRLAPHPAWSLLQSGSDRMPRRPGWPRTEQGGPDAHHRSAFLDRNLVIDRHSHRQLDQRRSGRSQAGPPCPGGGRRRVARPRDRGRRGAAS